jgi:hypothetical protein
MRLALSLAQVTKPVKELPVVGSEDYNFRVIVAEHRFLEPFKRMVAFFPIEF